MLEPQNRSNRMKIRGCVLVLPIALLTLGHSPLCAQQERDALRKRFLEEAPRRWEEYRKRAELLCGTAKLTLTSSWGESVSTRVEWKSNQRGKLLIEELSRKPSKPKAGDAPKTTAYGINSQYAFMLRKNQDGLWTLLRVDDRRTESVSADIMGRLEFTRTPVATLIAMHSESLPDVIRRPYFRVADIDETIHDGNRLVAVRFDYSHATTKSVSEPFAPVQSGTMILDPDRFWTVRSLNLALKYPDGAQNQYKLDVELADSQSSFPLPKRVTYTEKGKTEVRSVADMDLREVTEEPDETEFTLTAFGLLEPPGIEWKKPTPWWLWATLAGMTLLVVGAFFGWLKRRASTTAA